MNTRRRLLFFSMMLAMIAYACGGEVGEEDTLGLGDRGLDRCSLISEAEAADWLGGAVIAGPSEGIDGEPDPVTCYYESEDPRASVLVQVYDGDVFFAEVGSAARTGETVEGLGDDAWQTQGKVGFLQNDWSASVSLISGLVPDEDILAMAELMSSRLP